MASKQITMWLQGLFLFAVVWSLGGTITGDSRKKFDLFYRQLIKGEDEENPRPAGVKLQDKNLFPEKGRNPWEWLWWRRRRRWRWSRMRRGKREI